MLKGLAALGTALLATLAFSLPASAATVEVQPAAPWQPLDTDAGGEQTLSAHSQIVDATTADATWQEEEPASAAGTSIETANLGVAVTSGDEVSVGYELRDGASPAAGAVRLFVYDHPDANTWSEAPAGFVAVPTDGPTVGVLTLPVGFTGTIGTAGLVYDTSNGGVEGTVRFTELMVGDQLISFVTTKNCEAYKTPSGGDLCGYPEDDKGDLDCADLKDADRPVTVVDPTNDPYGLDADKDGIGCEVEPSPEPSVSVSPTPSQSGPAVPSTTPSSAQPPVSDNLPITGPPTGRILTVGLVTVLGGAVVYFGSVLWRRRRFEA